MSHEEKSLHVVTRVGHLIDFIPTHIVHFVSLRQCVTYLDCSYLASQPFILACRQLCTSARSLNYAEVRPYSFIPR